MSDIAYAVCGVGDIANRRARGFSLARRDGVPLHIVIVRWDRKIYGYENRCPHNGTGLDWERGQFLDPNGTRLMCGKHGALFDIATGACVEGPCRNGSLAPLRLAVIDGDVCIRGVALAEDEAPPAE